MLGWQCAPQAWEHNQRAQMTPPSEGTVCISTKNKADRGHGAALGPGAAGLRSPGTALVWEHGDNLQAGSAEQREAYAPQRPAGL